MGKGQCGESAWKCVWHRGLARATFLITVASRVAWNRAMLASLRLPKRWESDKGGSKGNCDVSRKIVGYRCSEISLRRWLKVHAIDEEPICFARILLFRCTASYAIYKAEMQLLLTLIVLRYAQPSSSGSVAQEASIDSKAFTLRTSRGIPLLPIGAENRKLRYRLRFRDAGSKTCS